MKENVVDSVLVSSDKLRLFNQLSIEIEIEML